MAQQRQSMGEDGRLAWLGTAVRGRTVRSWIAIASAVVVAFVGFGALGAYGLDLQVSAKSRASAESPGPLTADEVDRQAYWYSRYNLNAMLLMTGFGPRMQPPPEKTKELASIAGFDLSEMPKNPYLLRAVYAAGDPHFQQPGDFQDLSTLYWDQDKMVKRFEPAAQAFTIVKAVSKNLRTDYHRTAKDRFIALVQLQEAKAMADFLAGELTGSNGLVAAKAEGGELEAPQAYDQATALWAYSSLALALTDPDLPLYSQLPDAGPDAQKLMSRADALFQAMAELQPESARDLALSIEAFGWYAAATRHPGFRAEALDRVSRLGQRLAELPKQTLDDLAFAVYGLSEAARLSGRAEWSQAAQRLFFEEMERLWDAEAGVYAAEGEAGEYAYTPERVGAVLAAIHSVRLFNRPGAGASWDPALADRRYVTFFGNAVVRSGLQQAHAIALAVNPAYLEEEPRSYFTAPTVPLSIEGDPPFGTCPVYAAQITADSGVADRTFRTAEAMFLSIISTWHHTAQPDGFVPMGRLTQAVLGEAR
jgi:hypothetical protein